MPPPFLNLDFHPWREIPPKKIETITASLNQMHIKDQLGPSWPNNLSSKEWRKFFCQQQNSFAVIKGKTLIGGAGLRIEQDQLTAWFYYFILPKFRGSGYSEIMVNQIELNAKRIWPLLTEIRAESHQKNLASNKTLCKKNFTLTSTKNEINTYVKSVL